MSKYTYIDVFAGCGGLSLGMEQAGFTPVFMNDIDPICSKTYKFNFNLTDKQIFIGDIARLNEEWKTTYAKYIGDVDLVCGGPPCQGFSTANRQRLIDDPRNKLYKEYVLFLSQIRPKFFVMENVKGMQRKIDEIIQDFHQYLGTNYTFSYKILNAKNFGVPQNRERLIFIGNRMGGNTDKIFENIESAKYPHFVLKDALEGLPVLFPNKKKNDTSIENDKIGFKECAYQYSQTQFFKFINSHEVTKLYNHKNRYNNERDIEIFRRLPQGANSLHESIVDIMPYKKRLGIFKDKYFKLNENEVCKTITSHMKFDCNMYIHPTQPRGLSPREAARVQTFPDDFVFLGPQNSWYHQIGNAVPVKLAYAIGKEIKKWI